MNMSEEEAEEKLKKIDADGSGDIDKEEFASWWKVHTYTRIPPSHAVVNSCSHPSSWC